MNPTNEQELRKQIEQCFYSNVEESSDSIELFDTDRVIADIATFITAHTNAEIARVLDRLYGELMEEGETIVHQWQVEGAIEAERAKLKEVK